MFARLWLARGTSIFASVKCVSIEKILKEYHSIPVDNVNIQIDRSCKKPYVAYKVHDLQLMDNVLNTNAIFNNYIDDYIFRNKKELVKGLSKIVGVNDTKYEFMMSCAFDKIMMTNSKQSLTYLYKVDMQEITLLTMWFYASNNNHYGINKNPSMLLAEFYMNIRILLSEIDDNGLADKLNNYYDVKNYIANIKLLEEDKVGLGNLSFNKILLPKVYAVVFPLLFLFLYVNFARINRMVDAHNYTELNSYAWVILYRDVLSRIISVATIFVLPVILYMKCMKYMHFKGYYYAPVLIFTCFCILLLILYMRFQKKIYLLAKNQGVQKQRAPDYNHC